VLACNSKTPSQLTLSAALLAASAATRNQNKDETGGGREGHGLTGRGIFGRGMGNRPGRELFLCRTFLCRFFLNTFRQGKAVVRGMIVRGIHSLLPIPLTIIPLTNLLECSAKRPVVVHLLRFLAAIPSVAFDRQ
jgi:hypothetical protein